MLVHSIKRLERAEGHGALGPDNLGATYNSKLTHCKNFSNIELFLGGFEDNLKSVKKNAKLENPFL